MELTTSDVWTVVAAALVLFMTPGLALFYSGMTRAKSALNMMMMSVISMGLVGVCWVLWGYSMSGGYALINDIVGSPFNDFGLSATLADGGTNLLSVAFSSTFAIIAVAIISGSIADRARFGAWCIFVPLWLTLVYCPWLSWCGAAADGAQAGLIWVNTLAAPAAAMLGWALLERIRDGHVTSLGAASGLVSGLVAITSALGFIVTPATGTAGLFYGGGLGLLVTQTVATLISMAYCAVVTLLIVIPIHRSMGFRVSEKQEVQGIDLAQHAETAYAMSSGTSGTFAKN
ncbi:hypothetical protein QM007_04560 [Rothia sp. SD9660Na]|uniref:ammonium transporter n=1 Tax=Rothia sp. SD9660Na TaxID=3047030 RepID=UPI0024BB3461|nr:hypothetical protein [Rothia sp. SD9660Na]WHS51246.1 hypothetical protein QM007_04560 [Rothia sp. SD9660Na]